MKQNEKIQTRKDEVRFKTSDIRRIIGKYLAANVLRTWNEDFVDDETGEVVTIERNEILFERGKYIDNDLATEINFYLQSNDVKEVEVSNQRRLAYENKRTSLYPFKISATIGGKRHNFILQAQNIVKAYEVATDYIELNFTQPFDIVGIKLMDRVIILNDRLRKHVEAQEGANEEGEESNDGEEQRNDTKYYMVDLGIRNLILPKKSYDLGFSVENVVYFELLRRGYKVSVGKYGNTEIDFVAERNGELEYIQVTADMTAKETFDREMAPIIAVKDNYRKRVLTLDKFTIGNYDGIEVKNVVEWLTDK